MASRYRCRMFSLCVAASVLISAATSAGAHEHTSPDGSVVSWYESNCCNNGDCAPATHVLIVSGGLYITSEHGRSALVPPEFPRRRSQDMRWHVCISPHTLDLLCVYEPPSM